MIEKVRRRFIRLAMGSLFLVLLILIVAINTINYSNVLHDADNTLSVLLSNQGHFPGKDGLHFKKDPDFSPEAPYETRYFSVELSAEGSPIRSDTESIAAIDGELAFKMAETVLNKGQKRGFLGDYRYRLQKTEYGIRIIFLDWGRKLDASRFFLFTSVLISAAVLLVVYLLIWLFSPKIIRPIAESYEKQKRFITDAGHELKTPLTVISADSDVLEMEIGENEWLTDIKKQTRHLASLTNDLVFLARMEENGSQADTVDFPFSDIVEETVSSFQAPAKACGKTLLVKVEPMLSYNGREKDIRQLIGILTDNAIKYAAEGSEIRLRLEKHGKQLKLTCTNLCREPLSQEDIRRLFERFYRADPSRNSQTGGTGLGLSIAHSIVTAHGGKLQATMDAEVLTISASFPL